MIQQNAFFCIMSFYTNRIFCIFGYLFSMLIISAICARHKTHRSPFSDRIRCLQWGRSPAPFAKPHLRCSPLLRSYFLLMRWRSLRMCIQTDFHASMKSARQNTRVNCNPSLYSVHIHALSVDNYRVK